MKVTCVTTGEGTRSSTATHLDDVLVERAAATQAIPWFQIVRTLNMILPPNFGNTIIIAENKRILFEEMLTLTKFVTCVLACFAFSFSFLSYASF